jgi:glucose-6-phosphate 1-dehydrogenase
MAEDFGVKGRGRFYEEAGAIRDVIQNHLLQVMACLTMDPSAGRGPGSLRFEKARILKAVLPIDPSHVVRGQFRGYRKEKGVAPDSKIETFAAVKLFVDTWRWADMPIYIRAGKCLPVTITEIMVEFKRPPRKVFNETITGPSNYLRLRLNPDVDIALGLRVKQAGEQLRGENVELIATHKSPDEMIPYERLLGDALSGDATLFASESEVESQWTIVDPILNQTDAPFEYEPNTWGPPQANQLMSSGKSWWNPQPDKQPAK